MLPIAAAMFGVPFLGPTFGAGTFGASFLGSGIGSLIGGASIKDSLKAGLISGGIAGLTSGFTGPGSFGENLSSTFTGATPVFDAAGAQIGTQYAASPFADALGSSAARQASAAASKAQFGNLFSGDPLSAFTGENTLFGDTPTSVTDPVTGAVKPGFVGTAPTAPTAPSLNPLEGVPKKALGNDASLGSYLANRVPGDLGPGVQVASTDVSNLLPRNLVTGKTIVPVTGPTIPQGYYDEVLGGVADNMSTFQNFDAAGVVQPLAGAPKSLTERLLGEQADKALTTAGDYLTGGGRSAGDIASDVATAKQTYLKGVANDLANAKSLGLPVKGIGPTTAGLAEAAASAQPGMLAKYGPTAGIGLGAAYLGGAFDPPPEDNPDRDDLEGYVPTETGYDLFQKDPQKYLVQDMNPFRYDPGNPSVPTRYTSVADGGYMEKPQYMNMGGTPQFPRREMLVEGPGTERSDDIPAMLSDGEFVMNARAVRGQTPRATATDRRVQQTFTT